MNKLEKQHLIAILNNDIYEVSINGKQKYSYNNSTQSACNCAEITIEHMKGFVEWVITELEKGSYNQLYSPMDELIQLYFESLNNKL